MLPSWEDGAYFIYHVFAGMQALQCVGRKLLMVIVAKGHILSGVARLSQARRDSFVKCVVAALQRLPAPRTIERVSIFNPTKILSGSIRCLDGHQLSDAEICSAIGLPLSITKNEATKENEAFGESIPNMVHLCHGVNRGHLALMGTPAGVDSGASSTPIDASISTLAPISADGVSSGRESVADRSGSITVGRTSSSTSEMTPEGTSGLGPPTVPLPGAMGGPDYASLLTDFVGDSAVDSADRERLTRNDLMPMGVFIFHLTM